ncbi:MAG: hypothetical protein IT234_02175, partial [Bacteroidia bacterium]|nr:hypothetical protein [Bacteroidia bacterium]
YVDYFILANTGHDFGLYYEVAVKYLRDTDYEEDNPAEDEAIDLECGIDNWDDTAIALLIENKHPLHYTKIINLKLTA